MATINVKNPTIKDIIDGQTPDGKTVLDLVNLLSQENPFLEDMVMKECNQNDQNKEIVTTSLPVIKKRKYNEGVKSSKGTRAALTDATSIYAARCEVDVDLAELNGGTREFLMRENEVFIDAMSKSVAHDIIYGAQEPDNNGLIGFAERYSTKTRKNPTGEIPETADYVIDAGGSGNNLTSIWFCSRFNALDYSGFLHIICFITHLLLSPFFQSYLLYLPATPDAPHLLLSVALLLRVLGGVFVKINQAQVHACPLAVGLCLYHNFLSAR